MIAETVAQAAELQCWEVERVYKVRICFSKTGYAKYVSHLDLMKTFQRIFKIAKVDISYSKGFNPHPVMSIAHPLPLGVEGLREYMDIQVDSQPEYTEIIDRLNKALPADIRILKACEPIEALNCLTKAQYLVQVFLVNEVKNMENELNSFMQKERILIDKKTKKGVKETDIKPMIYKIELGECKTKEITMSFLISNGEPSNLKAITLLQAMEKYIEGFEIDYYSIKRSELYTNELNTIQM